MPRYSVGGDDLVPQLGELKDKNVRVTIEVIPDEPGLEL
jgi:hypothetical protein